MLLLIRLRRRLRHQQKISFHEKRKLMVKVKRRQLVWISIGQNELGVTLVSRTSRVFIHCLFALKLTVWACRTYEADPRVCWLGKLLVDNVALVLKKNISTSSKSGGVQRRWAIRSSCEVFGPHLQSQVRLKRRLQVLLVAKIPSPSVF